MRRLWIILGVIGLLIVLLFPINTTCGASNAACAIPPDESGKVGYYYEIEPFGITLIETMIRDNLRIYYSSGTERR